MSDLTDFLREVEDRYGKASIVEENSDFKTNGVISTGSISLDLALGTGGIPRGNFTEISGPESSGKTTVALSAVKSALEEGLKVLYVDVERAVDYSYIEKLFGEFDKSNLAILSPKTAEDAFLVIENALEQDLFDMIILDSLGAMSPQKELDDELTDANVALLPRLLTKWLRRNSFTVKQNNVAFVFINQVRDNIGAYMASYSTPGGHALKHFCTMQIKFTKGGKITGKTSNDVEGILTKFTVVKNKLAPPFKSATIPIVFGEGVDKVRDVIEFATTIGVLRRAGAYYRLDDVSLGQGMNKSIEYLKENPETLDKIIEMCYNVFNLERENQMEAQDV